MTTNLRLALRSLAKSPGFAGFTILILALGIGASTLTFSMVNAVLLRPFPAAQPDRLIAFTEANTARAYSSGIAISYANFVDWRRDNRTLSHAALYKSAGYSLTDGQAAEHVDAVEVTAGFFETFGIAPALGRGFSADEESPSAARAVVLSHDLWTRRFAADPAVLGRTVQLDAESYTVVGVMPASFRFPDNAALWTPVRRALTEDLRGERSYLGVGRLRDGVTLEQASLDLNVVAQRLANDHPATNALYGIQVDPFIATISGNYRRSALTLFGAVACLLLITCVNVASLQLARSASREREMAVRLALGSSRARIVRQLLGENLLLGLAGGLGGLLLTSWALSLLPTLLGDQLPYWMAFTLDRPVLLFSVIASAGAALVFGFAPAWQLSGVDLNDSLKKGGRSGSAASGRLMRTLVGAELALALVLLTGAGLLVKSFLKLQAVQPGFDASGVLTFRMTLPDATYPDAARKRDANLRLLERLQALPGVESAALVSDLPLANSDWGRSFTIAGRPLPQPGHPNVALNRVASADYFRTLRIPLRSGRTFDEHDTATSTPVVIIDEVFAQQYFPHENPLGQRIRYGSRPNNNPWMEIVGVVGFVRHNDLQNTNPGPGLYAPLTQQSADYGAFYALRTRSDPTLLLGPARDALASFDRSLSTETPATMTERVRAATWRDRLIGGIFAAFAAMALLLSALGIYGVTAFATAQRTREFGVRIALGAEPRDVVALVLRGGMRLALIAVVLGLGLALVATRFLAHELYAVSPYDPTVLALVAATIGLVALVASWLPARRATRVDPVIALRAE